MTAAGPEAENRDELAALCRMLGRAAGFRLGFVVANHPSTRARVATEVAQRCGVTVTETTLDPQDPAGIVAQLECVVGDATPEALFVHGLESMLDLRVRQSPALDLLNLNRDYCWRRFPWPVVFLAPLFAVREFARQATDFWSGRTGVYRLVGSRDDISETVAGLGVGFDWSLDPGSRLARREVLEHLRTEIDEQRDEVDPALYAETLSLLAHAAGFDDDRATQRHLLEQALAVYREIGDWLGEANAVQALGEVALMQARYPEAGQRYEEALAVYREIGNRLGEANAVKALGDVALMQARYPEAGQRYEEALTVYREIGNRFGAANAVQALGDVARMQARYPEAGQRYEEALTVYREIGNRFGAANAVTALGDVARMQARYPEAGQRYEEALTVYREIGNRLGEADTMLSTARLAVATGDRHDADKALTEALRIYRALGFDEFAESVTAEFAPREPIGQTRRSNAFARLANRLWYR
ncbi:MAG: tetratricopeptide repeat protein [Pseudonocardia sp.]